jgi:very-short-patch-repair endonuclease
VEIQCLDFGATADALSDLCKQGTAEAVADALPLLARAGELLDAGVHVRPGDVALLAQNLGEMRLRGAAVQRAWGSIAAWSEPSPHLFSAEELVKLVRAFRAAPKMPTPTRPLLEAIALQAVKRAHEFEPRALASVAHSYAKAGMPVPAAFWQAIAEQAQLRVTDFDAKGLSQTACAFAKAGVPAPELFAAIASHARPHLADFNQQDLSNTAWPFAKAGVPAPKLFAAIAAHAPPRLAEFNAQGLSNTAWAMATAGVRAHELFAAIAAHAPPRLAEFNAQDLSSTAWAFAKARVPAPELFAAIAAHAQPRLAEFNPQDLSNTALAFAQACVPAPELFAVIAVCAQPHLAKFNAQGLSNTAWAFATAGVPAPELFVAIAAHARARLAEFNVQGLSNTAWALSVGHMLAAQPAALHAPPIVSAVLSLAERCLQHPALHFRHTRAQVHRVQFALLSCHALNAGLDLAEQETERLNQLRGRAREMASTFGQLAPPTVSPGQRELSRRLRAAGWEHELKAPLEGSLLLVDMACTRTRVVVELDGPSHDLLDVATGEERHDGSTLGKTKLLEALGWRVHRVGLREWEDCPERVLRDSVSALCAGGQQIGA